jgi:hypothetical protein
MNALERAAAEGRSEMRRLLAERRAQTGRAFSPEQVAQVRLLTRHEALAS